MANNYYKFYKFIEILQQETDEEHILTMQQLQERISEVTGEKIDGRTVYSKELTSSQLIRPQG